jgi:hypothetical protein
MRDVYTFIRDGRRPSDPHPPAFATFEDGYRAACIVDAVLESHRGGGVWTMVDSSLKAQALDSHASSLKSRV